MTANLFYRGVVFRLASRIGDTLRTVTEVAGQRTKLSAQLPGLAHLRSLARANRAGTPAAGVLDWRFVVLLA